MMRQTFQLYGVLKEDSKTVFSAAIKNMGSTLGACTGLNRNVIATSDVYKNRPAYQLAAKYAPDNADLLAAQAGACYDVWLRWRETCVSLQKGTASLTGDTEVKCFGCESRIRRQRKIVR